MTDYIQLYFNIIKESIKDILSTSFYDPVFIYHLPETKLKYRKPTGNFTHKFIQYPTFSEPGYHVIYLECKSYIYIHKVGQSVDSLSGRSDLPLGQVSSFPFQMCYSCDCVKHGTNIAQKIT